jgi:hypothetical protein
MSHLTGENATSNAIQYRLVSFMYLIQLRDCKIQWWYKTSQVLVGAESWQVNQRRKLTFIRVFNCQIQGQ